MKARALRKRPGRKPKPSSALPQRPRCRDCRFRAPSGACLDPVLTSGRCGDYIRYLRGNKRLRRRYLKPANPRTPKQQRWRDRFGTASKKYSQSLTDEQQDAYIADGAKLRSRPRLGQSGPLTGQQYSIRKEYAAHAKSRKPKTAPIAKVPQWQRLTRKYKSQVLQPQKFTPTTPGHRRGASGILSDHHRHHTGRGSRNQRSRRKEEYSRHSEQPRAGVRQSLRVTRFTRERYRGGRWAKRRHVGITLGTIPVSRRASVLARPDISRPPARHSSRSRSPSSRWLLNRHRH